MELASGSLLRAYSQLSLHSQSISKQTLIIILLHSIKITPSLCRCQHKRTDSSRINSATIRASIFIVLIMYYKSFSCSQFSQMRWELIFSWSHDSLTHSFSHRLCRLTIHCCTNQIAFHSIVFSVHNQFATSNCGSTTCCKAKNLQWNVPPCELLSHGKIQRDFIGSIFLFPSANSFRTLLDALKMPPPRSLWCFRRDVIRSGYC